MGGPVSTAYKTVVPPTIAVSSSPCLSRHDRTSPWPLTPPAGRFVDVSAPSSVSTHSSSRYVQPHLLHYLVQQRHPGSTGHGSRRPSTAAGSSHQASPPSSSSVFYHADHGRASIAQQQPTAHPTGTPASQSDNPTYFSPAMRWTDWRCGLRPSGAVSFRAVVDGDDSRSSATEDHSSHQKHETTHAANAYHHNRLI